MRQTTLLFNILAAISNSVTYYFLLGTCHEVVAFSPAAVAFSADRLMSSSIQDGTSSTIVFAGGKHADEEGGSSSSDKSIRNNRRKKKLVLIRHGRTYMNDRINGTEYGRPGFTDVFTDGGELNKYKDSPLNFKGLEEVRLLNERIGNLVHKKHGAREELSLSEDDASILDELQLVVSSPLTRTLQTLQYGLYDHIKHNDEIPCIALPLASERVYLISDHGKPRSQLRREYNFVDFDSGFIHHDDNDDTTPWHYTPTESEKQNYVEWRPHGEGQVYACLGESQPNFDERMTDLYYWLNARDETVICLICHHGVIKWMLNGESFENCELRVVDMNSIQPEALVARHDGSASMCS